jgi:hypothetical protein
MKKNDALKRFWQFCSGPKLQFFVMPYFMAVLVAGTVAQKYMGLFPATEKFFNSFILWVGPLPLPGGSLALTVIFLNLCVHFVLKSQWKWPQLGTTLSHLGVLVLLAGGIVTLFNKQEGFIILQQGQPASEMYAYHEREFIIAQGREVLWQKSDKHLVADEDITNDKWPFTVQIMQKEPNVVLKETAAPPFGAQGVAKKYKLSPQQAKLEDELNQMGLVFSVIDKKTEKETQWLTTEFLSEQPHMKIDGREYNFTLKRQSRPLPFKLVMKDFRQDYYAGTDMARAYATSLNIVDGTKKWPSTIAMNEPLRYKGYTFYQSSVLNLPDLPPASVLACVRNIGWLFPYLASALIFGGLVLHAGSRRYAR